MTKSDVLSVLRDLLPPALIRMVYCLRGDLSPSFIFRPGEVDDYLVFLCAVVGGWLTPNGPNMRAFQHAIKNMPDEGAVIEIGSFLGKSTFAMGYLLNKYARNNPLVTCDPWILEHYETKTHLVGGNFDGHRSDYRDLIKQTFILNGRVFGRDRQPFTLEATSEAFLEDWRNQASREDVFGRPITLGGPISFAFIDGRHTYETTRADFSGIHSYLLKGGFVYFDDSSFDTAYPGTRQFTLELCSNPDYKLVWKTPNLLFRKQA